MSAIAITECVRPSGSPEVLPHRKSAVLSDAAEMWNFAHRNGLAQDLKALHRPRLWRSLGAVGADWLLIAAATTATLLIGWLAAPLSLFVIGNRQRALGNLLHDASHWSLDRNHRRSAFLANILLCWPLWVSMAIYRDEHNRHHRFLGDPSQDPDFIHDETSLRQGWVRVWLDQILSWRMIRGALFGHLLRMDAASFAGVACWWSSAVALVWMVSGGRGALLTAALWIAARVCVFHPITAFREISDHVGLSPGTMIGFSRNHPFASVLGQVFHPHNNGYHLLHHLNPGIPFHALPRAHALLMRWPRYVAEGEHCWSYFAGDTSATRSWVRRWASDTDELDASPPAAGPSADLPR